MRIKMKTQVELSSIADNIKDIGDISIETVSDLLTSGNTRVISILSGVSNYLVSLDTSKIKFIFIEVDNPVEIKIGNVNNTPVNISPIDGTTRAYFIATLGGDIDKIYFTNLSNTKNVNVRLVFAGK